MANLDEKFDKFTEVTLKTAARRRDEMLNEIQKEKQQRIAQIENVNLEKAYKTIQRGVANAQKQAAEQVSLAVSNSRREVLEYRESLIAQLFAALEQEIVKFQQGKSYAAFLRQAIADGVAAVGGGRVQVTLDVSDKQYGALVQELCGAAPEYRDGLLGGAIVASFEHKKICDNTLRAKVDTAREEFLEWSGFSIYQETGDAV